MHAQRNTRESLLPLRLNPIYLYTGGVFRGNKPGGLFRFLLSQKVPPTLRCSFLVGICTVRLFLLQSMLLVVELRHGGREERPEKAVERKGREGTRTPCRQRFVIVPPTLTYIHTLELPF